ncbi:glycosyltransferase family 2 protein [Pedococcus sp. KACC 23699]|uniref:Glycosyltransferase family 2 protein n=1 Tax=Pedococcus sp. KACC 23699 TaxID=3149228 RepID=A0AAU7JWL3_9MICO
MSQEPPGPRCSSVVRRPAPDGQPSVVVGLATYRRPADLARALPAVLAQVEELDRATARLVVVDNDPQASARGQVEGASPLVTYVHEPRPGISAARNRCIAEAADADALVFIDDDEVPDPGWLQALVDAWVGWGCAAVTGPVTSIFDGDADDWVRGSGVFARTERVTGSVNPGASSANLLLDLAVLRRLGISFDEAFGLSGGSDTMLAHSLRSRGEQIRWCQEAGVTEHVPAERSRRAWVFSRVMRTSNTWSRVGMALAATPARRARKRLELTARGVVRIVRGSLERVVARTSSDAPRDARGAVEVASGLGLLLGAWGSVRYEYRRHSGSDSVGSDTA